MALFGRKLVPMDEEGKQPAQEQILFEKGDLVKDKITGFTGVVVCVLDYLHGCIRVAVQDKELKDGLPKECQYYDQHQIAMVEKGHYFKEPEPIKVKERTGGDQEYRDNQVTVEHRINQRR